MLRVEQVPTEIIFQLIFRAQLKFYRPITAFGQRELNDIAGLYLMICRAMLEARN